MARQLASAVGADEALPVPRLVLERDPARREYLFALCALGRQLLLEAVHAVDVLFVGDDEGERAHLCVADAALEAGLVPLPRLVLDLFHARLECLQAGVASGGKVGVVALRAKYVADLGGERLVEEGPLALVAQEAVLVPVQLLVAHVLRVEPYRLAALAAQVGEVGLVAGHAAGVVVGEDVLSARQAGVAVPAAKVLPVPVLVEGPGVAPGKDELVAGAAPRLQLFRVVPLAVEAVLVDAVREVDQQLVAGRAREAGGVPHGGAHLGRHDGQAAHGDGLVAPLAAGAPLVEVDDMAYVEGDLVSETIQFNSLFHFIQ